MRELATPEEFNKHKERVDEVYNLFCIFLDKHICVHKGGDGRKIDHWIKNTYDELNITADEKRVLDVFFDTYLGTWATIQNRQLADAMMRRFFFDN